MVPDGPKQWTMPLCKKLLNSIMGSLDEGLMVLAISETEPSSVVYINPQFTTIFGYTLSELQGVGSAALCQLCDDDAAITKITNAVLSRTPVTLEMRCVRKDGSQFPCRVSINMSIKPDGEFDYLVVRNRDISKEREVEQKLIQSNISLISRNTELQTLATRDQLTSLHNRRYFDSQFDRLCGFHSRHRMPMCVAFIDIDCYKQYNDFYGHIAGDNVLRTVGREIKETFSRLEDITARFGGDEFVIVSSCDAETDDVRIHFDVLRKNVESLAIRHEKSTCGGVISLSIGVFVGIPTEADTPSKILNAADIALYSAKASGRNKTVIYSPELRKIVGTGAGA